MKKHRSLSANNEGKVRIHDDLIIGYTIHSMLHMITVEMDPTKLELLEGFKKTNSGHQYSPEDTSAKIIISGRDWQNKKFLIYGSKSIDEAKQYVEEVIKKIHEIGHSATVQQEPEVANLAINGDLGFRLNLTNIYKHLLSERNEIEYEPEQFPGLKFPIENPDCTFLLFGTGTFVIQGLKNKSDIEMAINKIVKLIPYSR